MNSKGFFEIKHSYTAFNFVLFLCLLFMFFRNAYSQNSVAENRASGTDTIHLSLEQAINRGLEANRRIITSAYGLDGSRISLQTSLSEFELKFIPNSNAYASDTDKGIGAGMTLEKKSEYGLKASIAPFVGRTEDGYTGRVDTFLDVPLLKGFGKDVNLNGVRSSEYGVRTAERTLYRTRVSIVLETVSSVYNVIKEKESVRLYHNQIKRLQGDVRSAKVKERVGMASPIDIYRAEIRLKDAQDGLNLSQESLRNKHDDLKLILALPMEQNIRVSAPLIPETIDIQEKNAVRTALANRVELAQARDALRESERQSKIAEHNLLPKLNLVAGYKRYNLGDDFGDAWRFNEDSWSINLVADTDWSRTAEKGAYKQSLMNIETTRLSMLTQRDEIVREVRRELDALKDAKKRIKLRKEQIRQAEGKLELARIKFNHGMASNFDVIESETELQRARLDLVTVQTDYIIGTYRFRSALGTLIEK